MALARGGAGKEHAVLAYRIAEPESFLDGPIADTLEFAHHNGPRLTARASEAVPGGCRIPIAAGL